MKDVFPTKWAQIPFDGNDVLCSNLYHLYAGKEEGDPHELVADVHHQAPIVNSHRNCTANSRWTVW